MEGPTFGWSNPYVVFSIIGSLLLSIVFFYYERHHTDPLIDMDFFKKQAIFSKLHDFIL